MLRWIKDEMKNVEREKEGQIFRIYSLNTKLNPVTYICASHYHYLYCSYFPFTLDLPYITTQHAATFSHHAYGISVALNIASI